MHKFDKGAYCEYMKRDVINGLRWVLEDDKFGFGVNWDNGDEPRTDHELAGVYITRAIHVLEEKECDKDMDKLRIENSELIQRILQLEKELAKERAYNYAIVTVIKNNNKDD